MNLGAEPKKVAILAVLGVVAAYTIYSNLIVGGDTSGPPPSARRPASPSASPSSRPPGATPAGGMIDAVQQAAPVGGPKSAQPAKRRSTRENVQEWTPTLKPRRPEDRPDPAKVDPRLRLDLLAKLQNVTYTGSGNRSLFDFSAAPPPPPKVPDIKILPKKGAPGIPGAAQPGDPAKTAEAPKQPEKPKAPPVPLKFYGFIASRDGRRGFFLNGDEIFTAGEGQVIQSRYRIVRLGLNSAIVSDTKFEGHQQTLPLEEPPAGT